ncbi:hypothetical protein DB346_06570 [Verrucomicrobia bacterium LW23]|nr:hypothetical protein DB346_06570 [Verrucomicrobia bacterium LW23]
MATKLDDAIRKVTSLHGVQAAFVFDQFLGIVTRDVPPNYGNDVLKRIANQLYQIATLSWNSGVLTQEFRLVYDRFAIYTRLFATNHYLVVFMDKDYESADFRQPINLSVLVLERAMRSAAEDVQNNTITQIAVLAEQTLRAQAENDTTFVGKVRRLAGRFLGNVGKDIVENGVEDEVLVLPIKNEREMRRLADYVTYRVPHPLIRRIIATDIEDILRSTLKA